MNQKRARVLRKNINQNHFQTNKYNISIPALPPPQDRGASVEQGFNMPYLCLIALGGTQPGTACLSVARYACPWLVFVLSMLVKNYNTDGRPRR